MNISSAVKLALAVTWLAASTLVTAADTSIDWSYDAQTGWPGVCSTGNRQSPINFKNASYGVLPSTVTYKIEFAGDCDFSSSIDVTYVPDQLSLKVADPEMNCLVTHPVTGMRFKVLQFHFHTPSEHILADGPGDAEVHIVTSDPSSPALMVIGAVYRQTSDTQAQPVASTLVTALFREASTNNQAQPKPQGSVVDLIPAGGTLTVYQGSLTTPPCSETVSWVVFNAAMPLPSGVLQQATSAMKTLGGGNYHNNRDAQPIGRLHQVRLVPSSVVVSISRLLALRALLVLGVISLVVGICIMLWKKCEARNDPAAAATVKGSETVVEGTAGLPSTSRAVVSV